MPARQCPVVSVSLSPRKSPEKAAFRWGLTKTTQANRSPSRDSDDLAATQRLPTTPNGQRCSSPSVPSPYSRRPVDGLITVHTPASDGAIPTLEWSQRYEGGVMIPRAGKHVHKEAPFRTQCSDPPPSFKSTRRPKVDVQALVDRLSPAKPLRTDRSPNGKRAPKSHYARREVDGMIAVMTPTKAGAIETLEWSQRYEHGGTIPRGAFERHIFGSEVRDANERASLHSRNSPSLDQQHRTQHTASPPPLSKALSEVRSTPSKREDSCGFTISRTEKDDLFTSMQKTISSPLCKSLE